MPIGTIVDAGPLYALFDRDDEHHHASVAFVQAKSHDLMTTWPVITEVAYLLRYDLQIRIDFLQWIRQRGVLVADISHDDLDDVIAILEKYADMRADFADATLVVLADRLGIREVATYDGDFRVYRYRSRYPFITLLLDD